MDNFRALTFSRQRQRNRIYETVIRALEQNRDAHGTKRKDIAKFIEVSPSQLSRWLSGPSNWTLDTVSDLMTAIDAELNFDVIWNKDQQKPNCYHELNFQPVTIDLTRKQVTTSSGSILAVHVTVNAI